MTRSFWWHNVLVLVIVLAIPSSTGQAAFNEAALNCPQGLGGILEANINSRQVRISETTIVFIGDCVRHGEFGPAVADAIRRLAVTSVATSNLRLIDQSSAGSDRTLGELLKYFVFYVCNANSRLKSRLKRYNGNDNVVRLVAPYTLFVIDDSGKFDRELAHIIRCNVVSDHAFPDVLTVVRRKAATLSPLNDTRLAVQLQALVRTPMQVLHAINIYVVLSLRSNRTQIHKGVLPIVGPGSSVIDHRELSIASRIECIKPLAVVEPSERALHPSTLSAEFYVGVLLSLCLVSWIVGANNLTQTSSIVYKLAVSILTSYDVTPPKSTRYFYVQRIALLTLFVPLLQWGFVNDYKNEVVAELTQPDRDKFTLDADPHMMKKPLLPYKQDAALVRLQTFSNLINGYEVCLPDSRAARDNLGIPLVTRNDVIDYGLGSPPLLRLSPALGVIREYNLMPLIPRFLSMRNTKMFFSMLKRSYVFDANTRKRMLFPKSKFHAENDWEAVREVIASCHAKYLRPNPRYKHLLNWCFLEILCDHSQLSAKLRLRHLIHLRQLFIVLIATSCVVFLLECVAFRCIR